MFNQTKNMSKFNLMGCASILALAFTMSACSSDDNGDNGGDVTTNVVWGTDGGFASCNHILFKGDGKQEMVDDNATQIGNGDQNFVFTGKQTLKKGTYTLKGWVYIANGAELTIEPGTVIKGDKATKAALVAERGGKLIAAGTASEPIVFTSAQAAGSRKNGDWGGIILCGKAPNNQNNDQQIEGGPRTKHGGTDAADNSGKLTYVRIEFGGAPLSTEANSEINGLTLGSVGSGTEINHVQVSYAGDDSYEWFGGTVNVDHIIAYKGWDDDFDTDNGFSGKVQFALSVRDPQLADQSQSNGFESDNCGDGQELNPFTSAVFSNVTFIGPKAFDPDFDYATKTVSGGGLNGANIEPGRFQACMQIRRNSHLNCFNSVCVGWPIGLIIEDDKSSKTQEAATNGLLKLHNIWFADMTITGSDANKSYTDNGSFSSTFFTKAANNNKVATKSEAASWFTAWGNYMPAASSPLLNHAADFTDALLNSGFTKVDYIGAFAYGDTWATGWTNFDPQNTTY